MNRSSLGHVGAGCGATLVVKRASLGEMGAGCGAPLVMNRASLGKAGAGAGFTLVMKRPSLGQVEAGTGAAGFFGSLSFSSSGGSDRGAGLGAGFGAGAEGLRETPTVPAVSIPPTPLRRAPSGVVITSAVNPAASATHGVRSGELRRRDHLLTERRIVVGHPSRSIPVGLTIGGETGDGNEVAWSAFAIRTQTDDDRPPRRQPRLELVDRGAVEGEGSFVPERLRRVGQLLDPRAEVVPWPDLAGQARTGIIPLS